MFRQEIQEAPGECVADLAGNNAVELLVGRKPIETCDDVSEEDASFTIGYAHPISSLGERLNDQILILLSPFAHPCVRVYDSANILDNVLLLTGFIVEGHSQRRQGLYNSLDVDFGAAGDTYMKMREGKFDELLHEI